ncbi:hypothetical protein [Rhizobium sp. SGZ-381]
MSNTRNYVLGFTLLAAVVFVVWTAPSSELAGQRSAATSPRIFP